MASSVKALSARVSRRSSRRVAYDRERGVVEAVGHREASKTRGEMFERGERREVGRGHHAARDGRRRKFADEGQVRPVTCREVAQRRALLGRGLAVGRVDEEL
jgi:hypothetical protein